MERFVKGDIVVMNFPFSDLTATKKRPAMIISPLEGNELILCQITSKQKYDKYSIIANEEDFEKGTLKQKSTIRPNKLFTAERSIIEYKIGRFNSKKIKEVQESIIRIIS